MAQLQIALTPALLLEKFPTFFTQHQGDLKTELRHLCSPEKIDTPALVFANKPEAIKKAIASNATALVVPKAAFEKTAPLFKGTLLASSNVELAMAMVARTWALATPYRNPNWQGVHATAIVPASCNLASHVTIGPYVILGENVHLQTGVFVGANSVIEANSSIGENTTVHPLVYIGHSTEIGKNCEILPHTVVGKEGYGYAHDEKGRHIRIPHMGRVVLEDDVHIGSGCTIDRSTFLETRIGAGTKMDNQCHIAHNCKVGAGSLLTAQFGMAGSSEVGRFFVSGGKASVTGHVKVTDGVQIGGYSAVSKDMNEPGQYAGLPLVPLQTHIKIKAAMVQLPEIRKQVARLMKKVFPEEG